MAQPTKSLTLNEAQSRYLRGLQVEGEFPEGIELNGRKLEGSPDAIETLREKLTNLLAERGFAGDYSPTAEGELIEDLIDVLRLG